MQRGVEDVEKREKELEERRREFEKEKEKREEERNAMLEMEPKWRAAVDALKKEINVEISVERKKAEEWGLKLETRVMKKVAEVLVMDNSQNKNSDEEIGADAHSADQKSKRGVTKSNGMLTGSIAHRNKEWRG
jgi:hypothetical protein